MSESLDVIDGKVKRIPIISALKLIKKSIIISATKSDNATMIVVPGILKLLPTPLTLA